MNRGPHKWTTFVDNQFCKHFYMLHFCSKPKDKERSSSDSEVKSVTSWSPQSLRRLRGAVHTWAYSLSPSRSPSPAHSKVKTMLHFDEVIRVGFLHFCF